jgi:hypothetical protein
MDEHPYSSGIACIATEKRRVQGVWEVLTQYQARPNVTMPRGKVPRFRYRQFSIPDDVESAAN